MTPAGSPTTSLSAGVVTTGLLPAGLIIRAEELRPGLEPLDVSPGLLGFVVIFALVLACIPLFRSLTGKLRKVDRRAEEEAEAAWGTDPDEGVAPRGRAADDGTGPGTRAPGGDQETGPAGR